MTRYDTRFDPMHWTARDGRVLPVDGTHVIKRRDGELVSFRTGTDAVLGKPCSVCTMSKTRERADRFFIGQRVEWSYRDGTARGQVIAVAHSRVQVMWQNGGPRGRRPIWKRAIDLRVAVSA